MRGLAACLLAALFVLLPTLSGVGVAKAATAPSSTQGVMLAANYFGEASPVNFWSSDLSHVRTDFERMKAEGFNTVGLVVPWGEFQPGLTPVRYNDTALSRLRYLVGQANGLHLGVIIRLSYAFDNYPGEQLPGSDRFVGLFGNSQVRQAWLDYLSKVHSEVASYSNIRGYYLSWEDFWTPITSTEGVTGSAAARRLAVNLGFHTWLRYHYSLSDLEQLYGMKFPSYVQVPVPSNSSAAFSLILQYEDWALTNELFEPALQRIPGLSLEARIDSDQYTANGQTESYNHASLFQLPGTTVTGTYFSPYMNDPSSSKAETAQQGLQALTTTLNQIQSESGGRKVILYEYEFVSNAPAVAADPALTSSQVGPFVTGSIPLLQRYTSGYGLFAYRDFNASPVYNPSFALGTEGWKTTGHVRSYQPSNSSAYLALSSGATVRQSVPAPGGSGTTTVSVTTDAVTSGTKLTVDLGPSYTHTLSVTKGWRTYQVRFPTTTQATRLLTLRAGGSIRATNVQLYCYTQIGDVNTVSGQAGPALSAVMTLNHQLAAGGH